MNLVLALHALFSLFFENKRMTVFLTLSGLCALALAMGFWCPSEAPYQPNHQQVEYHNR